MSNRTIVITCVVAVVLAALGVVAVNGDVVTTLQVTPTPTRWYDGCPGLPDCDEPGPTYTPEPQPTCRLTPTCALVTAYPTSTPWPTQPPWATPTSILEATASPTQQRPTATQETPGIDATPTSPVSPLPTPTGPMSPLALPERGG